MNTLSPSRALFLSFVLSLTASHAAGQGPPSPEWEARIGVSGTEGARAMVHTVAGDLYLIGNSAADIGGTNLGEHDAFISRLDDDGNILWIRQFGTQFLDIPYTACEDSSGGILIAGRTFGDLGGIQSGQGDIFVARFSPAGVHDWTHQFGSTEYDFPYAMLADDAGGYFLVGETYGALAGPLIGFTDAFVVHVDATGARIWGAQFGGGNYEHCRGVASDGAGGVIVGGSTRYSAANTDFFATRFDASGTQLWYQEFGTPDGEIAHACTSDGEGGAYLAGMTTGDFEGTSAGVGDMALLRIDGSGQLVWKRQLGSSMPDMIDDLALDQANGVWVAGWTSGDIVSPVSSTKDAFVARFDADGNRLWGLQYGSDTWNWAYDIELDGAGGAYVAMTEGAVAGYFNSMGTAVMLRLGPQSLGREYCSPAAPNSTLAYADMRAEGSDLVDDNSVSLVVSELPANVPVMFMTDRLQGFGSNPLGGQGSLCLATTHGRFLGPGELQVADSDGTAALAIDLQRLPQGAGRVAALPGETWFFQAWYRDTNPTRTSNFSDALSLMLR